MSHSKRVYVNFYPNNAIMLLLRIEKSLLILIVLVLFGEKKNGSTGKTDRAAIAGELFVTLINIIFLYFCSVKIDFMALLLHETLPGHHLQVKISA